MNRYIFTGMTLLALLSFNGCGSSNTDTATEESSPNYATGIVRVTTNVIEGEHLLSHYYGEENSVEEGKHILILQKDSYDLQENDSLVFGKTEHFQNGLIRKIESIHHQNGSMKVITRQAALDDVFSELKLSHSQVLKPAPIVENDEKNLGSRDVIRILHKKEGVTFSQGSGLLGSAHDKDFTIDFTGVDLGHGVSIDGSIGLSIATHLRIHFYTECNHKKLGICYSWKTHLGHTYFYIEPEESGEVILSASETHSFEKRVTVAHMQFPTFDIQIGPVPVIVTPKLSFSVDLTGEVTAEMSMGFTQDITAKLGITHKKKDGKSRYHWYTIKSIETDFKVIEPAFDVSAEVKLAAGPQLELELYGVTGPTVSLDAYIKADIALEDNPWWSIYYGIEADAGFALDMVGHEIAEVNYQLYDYSHLLAEADGSFSK